MRTIAQIKKELTDAWLTNPILKEAYNIPDNTTWEQCFSRVSIENLILYIVAAAIYTHERLFEEHLREVNDIIDNMKPHTLKWYVNKIKAFRAGQDLIAGTDTYSDGGLTEDDIAAREVVKYAAASESEGFLYIKVATSNGSQKEPLSDDQLLGLHQYIAEVKDAGVQVSIINQPACHLKLDITIFYNPMVLNESGENIDSGSTPVNDAIKEYIENLPFNGEYRNAALINALQRVEGVVIPHLNNAEESIDNVTWQPIVVKSVPSSGYYHYNPDNINITFTPYE